MKKKILILVFFNLLPWIINYEIVDIKYKEKKHMFCEKKLWITNLDYQFRMVNLLII